MRPSNGEAQPPLGSTKATAPEKGPPSFRLPNECTSDHERPPSRVAAIPPRSVKPEAVRRRHKRDRCEPIGPRHRRPGAAAVVRPTEVAPAGGHEAPARREKVDRRARAGP